MSRDDINNQELIVTGIVSAIIVFVIVLCVQALYYWMETNELNRKLVAQQPEALRRLLADQEAQIHSYRMIDPQKKIVAIPIERAMELTVREGVGPASVPAGRDAGPTKEAKP